MTDQPSFAEYLNTELMRSYAEAVDAATTCMLCGETMPGHDQAACDAKMAAWKPVGLLSAHVQVPHELLVDSGGHVCGTECPPPDPPYVPAPTSVGVRLRRRARRVWRAVKRVPGLRLVHWDRVDRDLDC